MTDKTDGVLGHLASMALAHGEKWESIHDKVAELLSAAERNLANLDLINPPDGPYWSGSNDQEALREAIRAMRGDA